MSAGRTTLAPTTLAPARADWHLSPSWPAPAVTASPYYQKALEHVRPVHVA